TALTDQGLENRVDGGQRVLVVRFASGREARLSVGSLYDGYSAGDRGLDDAVGAIVRGLQQMRDPSRLPELAEVRERVFPVLRPKSFLAQSGPTLSTDAPGGLLLLYVVDYPDFVGYLPPETAEAWQLSMDELAQLAFANLDREPLAPTLYRVAGGGLEETRGDRWDLLAFDAGDGYDASRLLSKPHREAVRALSEGPWVVAMPTRAYALLARASDSRAVGFLKQIANEDASGPQAVTRELYLLSAEGDVEPYAGS
ncbi:MAG: DUF1444 family protein, partial [Myxococcales bacterium]